MRRSEATKKAKGIRLRLSDENLVDEIRQHDFAHKHDTFAPVNDMKLERKRQNVEAQVTG